MPKATSLTVIAVDNIMLGEDSICIGRSVSPNIKNIEQITHF